MKRVLTFALAAIVGGIGGTAYAQETAEKPESKQEQSAEGRRGQRGQGRGQGRGMRGQAAQPTPVAVVDGKAILSPENTKVNFVGKHEAENPEPRLGGFQKFKGELAMSEDGSAISGMTMEFETGSVWTEIGAKLTDHLKNEDFLDVEKYPTAKFVSKSVSAGEEGMVNVVGDFTLMGKTNEITIPVKMTKSDEGVLVKGELKLDRTSFGMNEMLDRVSKEVAITLSVGEKTVVPGAGGRGQGGRGQGGRGQGGRGGFDVDAFFKNQDADGDGKLSGDEIPQRMSGALDRIDTDKDGSISMEEMKAMMERRGGGGGGRGQRGGGGGGR